MDLRMPIGLLFTLLGILLLAFGAAHGDETFHPPGININLAWGGVLLTFGIVMLLLARAAARAQNASPPAPSGGEASAKR